VAAGAQNSSLLNQRIPDQGHPSLFSAVHIDGDAADVDAGKPASQPVVSSILDDIEKGR
jgi:hypothetical protein